MPSSGAVSISGGSCCASMSCAARGISRIAVPGATRPARPERCRSDACDQGLPLVQFPARNYLLWDKRCLRDIFGGDQGVFRLCLGGVQASGCVLGVSWVYFERRKRLRLS